MSDKVIIVEGLIGAGKSVFSDELGEALTEVSGKKCEVLIEPATAGEKGGANPYLQDYYSNPDKWAFPMQCHLLQERFRMQDYAQDYAMAGRGHAVLDRSFYGDVAFLELQMQDNHLDPREYATYHRLYEMMTRFIKLPTVCIRLLVSPEVARKRISVRASEIAGRQCEAGVSLDYLQRLDDEVLFVCQQLEMGGTVIINEHWNQDRRTKEDRAEAIHALAEYIHNLPCSVRPRELHRRRI